MVKSFLRYVQDNTFGSISTANVIYDKLNKRAIVCCLENIVVWNLRKGEIEFILSEPELENKPSAVIIALNPDGRSLAAGYTDGTIRLWSFPERSVMITLSGHRTEITALKYNHDGTLLGSGSKENEVVIWDVAQERGLYRLRGHTNAITDICFIKGTPNIASSSKDGFVKIWDSVTQHCIQTLVGHRGEIQSVIQCQDKLITGATDSKLKFWEIIDHNKDEEKEKQEEIEKQKLKTKKAVEETKEENEEKGGTKRSAKDDAEDNDNDNDNDNVVKYLGEISLDSYSNASLGRGIRDIQINKAESFLAAIVGDKTIVCYKISTLEEIAKKRKRRIKRMKEKQQKKAKTDDIALENTNDTQENDEVADLLAFETQLRTTTKIRGFSLNNGTILKILVSMNDNQIHEYQMSDSDQKKFTLSQSISAQGHRHDIRASAISQNCDILATVDSSELKLWRISTRGGVCISTQPSDYGLCVVFCPGERHVLVGTKSGNLELHEISSGRVIETIKAHNGSIWSISISSKTNTVVTASSDKSLKFWDFDFIADTNYSTVAKRLTLTCTQTVTMEDEVLCAKYSPLGKYLVASLLDCTIKVYKADTMKFYLSLYGHKLPALTLDVSDDEKLLISGSADKNVKIWGLDFGDCHKSLFAHDDSVSQVVFQPLTHYFFSAGKDGSIKQWDADKFDCIQLLSGHYGAIWSLNISKDGTILFSVSQDRSIRIWKRTDEQIFLDEERDKAMETTFEKTLIEQEEFIERNDPNLKESELGSKKTLETIKTAESLIDTLELAVNERTKMRIYDEEVAQAVGPVAPYERNILLRGQTPSNFLLNKLVSLPPSHLDQAMLLMPFNMLPSFLEFAIDWIKKGKRIELVSDCVFFLFRLHQGRLSSSSHLHSLVLEAKQVIGEKVQEKKDIVGFNLAGLNFLKQRLENDSQVKFYVDADAKLHDITKRSQL